MSQEADPWRVELDQHIEAVRATIDAPFDNWAKAEDADELTAAAEGVSPDLLVAVQRQLKEIAAWYRSKHDEAIVEAASAAGLKAARWKAGPDDGWLMASVRGEIGMLRQALGSFYQAASECAAFASANSSVGGLIESFARGFLDPIDGLLEIFGEGSVSREVKRLDVALARAGATVEEAEVELLHAIDSAVVDRWNERTVGALEEIEATANEQEAQRDLGSSGPGRRWLGWAMAVLILGLGAGGYFIWNSGGLDSNRGGSASERIVSLPSGTELLSGPAPTFESVAILPAEVEANVMDASVPGWIKVRTRTAIEGWARDVATSARPVATGSGGE